MPTFRQRERLQICYIVHAHMFGAVPGAHTLDASSANRLASIVDNDNSDQVRDTSGYECFSAHSRVDSRLGSERRSRQ